MARNDTLNLVLHHVRQHYKCTVSARRSRLHGQTSGYLTCGINNEYYELQLQLRMSRGREMYQKQASSAQAHHIRSLGGMHVHVQTRRCPASIDDGTIWMLPFIVGTMQAPVRVGNAIQDD